MIVILIIILNSCINNVHNLNTKHKGQSDDFIEAAKIGDIRKINSLLSNVDINYKDSGGDTALILASMNGHIDIVKILIEKGANIKDTNIVGETALMLASMNGHKDIVELLKKKDTNIKSELIDEEEMDFHYFTKCEYYTRYEGTSHFAMNDWEYWATYFRSTGRGGESGRFTKKDIKLKTFKNLHLNIKEGDSYHSRTGTFYNPYTFEDYKKSVEKPEKFQSKPSNKKEDAIKNSQILNSMNPLYEELLDYRNQICLQVFNKALISDPRKILKFIHHNEYPCLIVKTPFINYFTNIESWSKLLIAYYIAIINKKAEKESIPIEMVIRSGFGHLLPSIDVTGSSFRINVGIVPTCYGEPIVESLMALQEIIINGFNNPLEIYEQIDLDKMNKGIKTYNESKSKDSNLHSKPVSVPLWDKKQKCYEILQLVGDSKGQSVLYQITRKRAYLDLLADYVATELDKEESERDLTLPIIEMLGHLDFSERSVSTDINKNSFKRNTRKWQLQESFSIQEDEQFWKTIKQIVKSIGGDKEIYNERTLYGLYSKLEKLNKEFIIRSASTIDAEEGLGSDSEYEAENELSKDKEQKIKKRLYAKKLTVTTGMMAINVAHYLARYYLKKYLKKKGYQVESKRMYYETGKALKLSKKSKKELAALNNRSKNNPSILFFDLNYCDISGAQSTRMKHYIMDLLAGKNIPIIVMDYSSSTTSHIKCAISDAIDAGIKLILLVSSGLKNEQLSADNPYGTVRIIALKRKKRDDLYKKANQILKENGAIPATAHKIRKGYKRIGLVPTNQQILNADTNRKNFEEQDIVIINKLYKNLYKIYRYKETLLGQINNLSKKLIHLTELQREIIGEVRSSELEKKTVIDYLEDILCEMICDELKAFLEEQIKITREQAVIQYEQYGKRWEKYEQRMEERNYEGPVKPQEPSWISNDYGDLDDLSNLIKMSKIEDDTLSQILYDNFISIEGMDYILESLEYNTLNLDPSLVYRFLNDCDVQFYEVDPTKKGFLIKYLKESIEEKFARIANAYQEGRGELGETPLHEAVKNNKIEKIKKLLKDKGTDINAQDTYGDTPLHLASNNGYLDIVKFLVEKGANINIKSKSGDNPLGEAILYRKLEVFKFLLEAWKNPPIQELNDLLYTASRQGNTEAVSSLIKKGIKNVNIKDDRGNTPLHIAALNAHIELAILLIEQGADINAKNNESNTPIDSCASSILCSSHRYHKYSKLFELLIKNGAKIEKNKRGYFPTLEGVDELIQNNSSSSEEDEVSSINWNTHTVAEHIWKDPNAPIDEEQINNVKTASLYLEKFGYQLEGVKADGNCFFHAFIASYNTIPKRNLSNKLETITTLREKITENSNKQNKIKLKQPRIEEIKKDKQWINIDEGALLAKHLNIPIRIVTANTGDPNAEIDDRIIFPNMEDQIWNELDASEKPNEFVFIIDLGGHFVWAKPKNSEGIFAISNIGKHQTQEEHKLEINDNT